MSFLYDNAAVLAIAAVCSALAWLYGGINAPALLPTMPWLVAILCEAALFFPQRHADETLSAARERVWARMKHDPVFWLSAVFIILLAVPFVNKGLCPCCDYPAIHFDGKSEYPPAKFLPFCIDPGEHFTVFLWFLCALPAMLATKHSLLKRGKRRLVSILVWNGLALAILGMVQHVTGAEAPLWSKGWDREAYFFSTFGYPNMGADYFTTLFAMSCAAWRWRLETEGSDESRAKANHTRFWRSHIFAIPAAFSFFGAMMTLSRAGILLCSAAALLIFLHTMIDRLSKMRRSKKVKAIAGGIIAVALAATAIGVLFSDKIAPADEPGIKADFKREVDSIDGRGVLDRVAGKGQYHNKVALRVWRKHPVFGCGGWGYKHLCLPNMTDEEYESGIQTVGGTNVHNDYLQFLAEHGAVGFGILAGIFALLCAPVFRIWKALAKAARFATKKERPASPVAIFALPAPAFCLVVAVLATVVHSFGDCPMRSPAVLTLFFTVLAAIDGYLPRLRRRT